MEFVNKITTDENPVSLALLLGHKHKAPTEDQTHHGNNAELAC